MPTVQPSAAASGRGSRGRRIATSLAEINVVPLVDVMLVLLIIFMITAPMMNTGVDLDLPQVTAKNIEDPEGKLVMAIAKNNRIFLGGTQITWKDLGAKLKARQIDKSPFTQVPQSIRSRARWVKPELVAEIAFTERTRDGILRHPVFLGLREDKRARDVTGEDRGGRAV